MKEDEEIRLNPKNPKERNQRLESWSSDTILQKEKTREMGEENVILH